MESNQKRSEALKTYWSNAIERRLRLSNEMKGKNNPAKSITARKKISESKLGKHWKHIGEISEKQRMHLLRMAALRMGKKHSLETRSRISLSLKGKYKGPEHPFYGKSHNEFAIKKMKMAQRFLRQKHLQDIFRKAENLGINLNSHLKQRKQKQIGNFKKYQKIDPLGYIIGTIPTDAFFGFSSKKDCYVYAISAKDKDFIETVIGCIDRIFDFRPNLNKQRNLWRIQIGRKQIEFFVRFIEKENGTQWVFNKNVLNSKDNFRRSLLMAVCDAEGCITNSGSQANIISRRLTITNSSLLLLNQTKSLLESFGIRSYIYHHRDPRIACIRGKAYQFKKHIFTLIITGYNNLLRFKNIIGFSIHRKQNRLKEILNSYKNINRYYCHDDYNLTMEISKYFNNCGDISKLVNIPPHTVRNWVLYNRKPRSIKMLRSI